METNVQYITDEQGQKKSVILQMSDYERIMEDLHDFKVIAERKDEPSISHDDFLKELERDGIV